LVPVESSEEHPIVKVKATRAISFKKFVFILICYIVLTKVILGSLKEVNQWLYNSYRLVKYL